MITERIKKFVERSDFAYVASADNHGLPHLAAGRDLAVPDPGHLVFRAWFCVTTLRNLERNPRLCVAVVDPQSGDGFQFVGRMAKAENAAFMDGYLPQEAPGMPQVQLTLEVAVEMVLDFSAAAHSDRAIE